MTSRLDLVSNDDIPRRETTTDVHDLRQLLYNKTQVRLFLQELAWKKEKRI